MIRATVWTRLRAAARGEISAETLEAYRSASLPILRLLEEVDGAREVGRRCGQSPWTLTSAEQAWMVAAWNAFILQTLGTSLLDAEYHDSPGTVGFVPPITEHQVLAFFAPVAGWLGRAQRASSDPNYTIDVPLPAHLPAWDKADLCPDAHTLGMFDAMRTLRVQGRAAVAFLGHEAPNDPEDARQYHAIQGLFAATDAQAAYCEDLRGPNPTHTLNTLLGPTLKETIESFHKVGQAAAMPSLTRYMGLHTATAALSTTPSGFSISPFPAIPIPSSVSLPNQAGFDPWCLTDPNAKQGLMRSAEAKGTIGHLWRCDPDPTATLALLEEIRQAERRGDIGRAADHANQPVGHYFACPWGTVYEARRPIHLGDRWLTASQRFVIEVNAEGYERGLPFRRGIRVGDFAPADGVAYGLVAK